MSSVIKIGTTARVVQGVAFNFEDMTQKANAYLEQVRAQAAQVLAKAQQEAQAVRARAEQEGRQAAAQAAEQSVEQRIGKRLETLLPALREATQQIQHARQDWLKHWEGSAVRLATKIAGRVIRREVERTPDITLDLVRESLELAAGSSQLRIHLHPTDREALGGQVQRLVAEMTQIGSADIVADASVTLGSCRLETQHGSIDQSFDAQLARIAEELT